MVSFDLVVIGSGPGGYVCAIRASQLGMKVAIIEKYSNLGGTCLNVGCIPSKSLLESSELYHKANTEFLEHGIKATPKFDFPKMVTRKSKVVKENSDGLNFLMKKNKISVFHGLGRLTKAGDIEILSDENKKILKSKNVVIATGSKPIIPSFINFDKKRVISSTEALSLKECPKTLSIVGAGVIGLELGSVFARLGTKVKVFDYSDSIISFMDKSLSDELKKVLTNHLNFEFNLSNEVQSVKKVGEKVEVISRDKTGAEIKDVSDYCLVSVGRKPFTEGLGLENLSIDLDERGRIKVNKKLQTSIPNIYAIGDVIQGPMLAHKAEEEGVFVAETIAGQIPHIDYNLVPSVIYTWPEVSSVGKTEKELRNEGRSIKVGKFPFKANGRARISMDLDGFIKVICDSESDEILGVHMIGPRCADLISEAVVAMEYKASAEDIARICHAHPTFSEAFKEAALDATEKRSLNF
ncbi:MAG: dihydrolipoyl dehydrogenase [Flavobacteriales bacterium]|nr:dihydrolipoyl dehydrogenase [Flavobacteriales bacterium]|tara:strand:+ start:20213 stop:21613 length:1401 start_codon:yes stop_codon:yes gene_type:complete